MKQAPGRARRFERCARSGDRRPCCPDGVSAQKRAQHLEKALARLIRDVHILERVVAVPVEFGAEVAIPVRAAADFGVEVHPLGVAVLDALMDGEHGVAHRARLGQARRGRGAARQVDALDRVERFQLDHAQPLVARLHVVPRVLAVGRRLDGRGRIGDERQQADAVRAQRDAAAGGRA
eukprot:2670791-Prymnesium_polylepis.1